MQIKNISHSPAKRPNLLRKTAAFITTIALAGMVLMFSAILLVFILIVFVFAGAFLWWKTRKLRLQMQNVPSSPHGTTILNEAFAGEAFKGNVIEGEVIRVEERRAGGRR